MNRKKEQIINLGGTAIGISLFIDIPLAILLFCMVIGAGKQSQFGYSLYLLFLMVLGTIPLLLSIIFGIVTYVKYHRSKQSLPIHIKKIALSALLLPIISTILMFLAIMLDTFVFY